LIVCRRKLLPLTTQMEAKHHSVTASRVGKYSAGESAEITRPFPRRRVQPADNGRIYGRFSDLQAAYSLQLPSPQLDQCQFRAFVPDYRCGAVPDSHRIPLSPLLEADTGNSLSIDQINIPNNANRRGNVKALSFVFGCYDDELFRRVGWWPGQESNLRPSR
jgi:hypothetical protein